MKKSFVLVMTLVIVMMVSSITFAASTVDVSGTAATQWRYETSGNEGTHGGISSLKLNGSFNATDNLSVYTRFVTEGKTNSAIGGDFFTGDKSETSVDKFGVIYKNAGVDYKLGRQDLTIGSSGVMYDNSWKLGRNVFVDGITAKGKVAGLNIKAVAIQEDSKGTVDNRVYALSASKPIGDLVLTGTIARYDNRQGGLSTNNAALGASYTVGKTNVYGEYGVSNADTQNKAYSAGVNYALTNKDIVYGLYYKVEANGDIGKGTSFWNDCNGVIYGVNHNFDKSTILSLQVWNNKGISAPEKVGTSFRTTLAYNF